MSTSYKCLPGLLFIFLVIAICPGCHTAKKMDVYVAEQYNNQLPGPDRKKNAAISVSSAIPFSPEKAISVTKTKTSKVVPLIVYWSYDYRHTCSLNPAIAVGNFTSVIHQQTAKMVQKLNGRQLELTVEQVPNAFALADKGWIILIAIHWDKLFVDPDGKDLIVSYKIKEGETGVKEGRITVNNDEKAHGRRFAQSWKSSISEYLQQYNADVSAMSKSFVNKLLLEL